MEKEWAVYGAWNGAWGVGKIERELPAGELEIKYCERQQYPSECWDSKWIKRFENPLDAVKEYAETGSFSDFVSCFPKRRLDEALRLFRSNFPSQRKLIE
jgi:hypothetical protein